MERLYKQGEKIEDSVNVGDIIEIVSDVFIKVTEVSMITEEDLAGTKKTNLYLKGEIISNGEQNYASWLKKYQSLSYMFKTESEIFITKETINSLFECKSNQHPEILKKYLKKAISLETLVILDSILGYVSRFDKKLLDPVWETVSLKIKKYRPFLNIDESKYKEILKEIVL